MNWKKFSRSFYLLESSETYEKISFLFSRVFWNYGGIVFGVGKWKPDSEMPTSTLCITVTTGLLLSCSPVSSDRTDQHSWGRQQRVPGDLRDHPYREGMCVSVLMNRVTGILPLGGELCVHLCDRVGMYPRRQGLSSFFKTEGRCRDRIWGSEPG